MFISKVLFFKVLVCIYLKINFGDAFCIFIEDYSKIYRGLLKKIRIIFYITRVKIFNNNIRSKRNINYEDDFASVISSINGHHNKHSLENKFKNI